MTATGDHPVTPVTVVGGYLGAGKTTLVNHLLRNAAGLRLAVLVNDFGALPIDADLIESQDGDTIAIAGGCVCCSYGSDMTDALRQVLARDPAPDHIVLEASGVALPGVIAASVDLMPGLSTDGVVILADTENLISAAAHPYMGDTITRQLADADLVILNKIDLADPAPSVALIARSAGRAAVVQAKEAAVPPDLILRRYPDAHRSAARHDTDGYATLSLPMVGAIDPQDLAQRLAKLGLLRAKGFVLDAQGARWEVQATAARATASPVSPGGPLGLVLIGLRETWDPDALSAMLSPSGADARSKDTPDTHRETASPPL